MDINFTNQAPPYNTYPKDNATFNYPVHATSISNLLKRTEPVIDPRELKDRF